MAEREKISFRDKNGNVTFLKSKKVKSKIKNRKKMFEDFEKEVRIAGKKLKKLGWSFSNNMEVKRMSADELIDLIEDDLEWHWLEPETAINCVMDRIQKYKKEVKECCFLKKKLKK